MHAANANYAADAMEIHSLRVVQASDEVIREQKDMACLDKLLTICNVGHEKQAWSFWMGISRGKPTPGSNAVDLVTSLGQLNREPTHDVAQATSLAPG